MERAVCTHDGDAGYAREPVESGLDEGRGAARGHRVADGCGTVPFPFCTDNSGGRERSGERDTGRSQQGLRRSRGRLARRKEWAGKFDGADGRAFGGRGARLPHSTSMLAILAAAGGELRIRFFKHRERYQREAEYGRQQECAEPVQTTIVYREWRSLSLLFWGRCRTRAAARSRSQEGSGCG